MDGFERRGEPDGPWWLIATGLESRGVVAAFTERTGGRSAGPFESLNLGIKERDDPAAVRANREAVREALAVAEFAFAEQVHGAQVADVTRDGATNGFDRGPFEGCDALTTIERGVPLSILTADCVPVALADGARIAAVHVGWRGAAGGVLQAALARFEDRAAVSAAVGPAIRACHYEVGRDVATAVGDGLAVADPIVERRAGSWYLDLAGTVAASLRASGVRDVTDCGLCTACETDRFFSYRRDGRTGRQALVVARR
jgi:YfiH family protein